MAAIYLPGGAIDADRDVVNFRGLKIWAENGLVHLERTRDGWYGSMAWQEAERRLLSIAEAVFDHVRVAHSHDQIDRKAVKEHKQFVNAAIRICRKAQQQGSPFDPGVAAARASDRSKPLFVGASGGLAL